MMKRVTWFAIGAAAGVTGSAYAKRKVRATAGRLAPNHLAKVAGERVRRRGRDVVEAVREGRAAMVAKEEELRRRVEEPSVPGTGTPGTPGLAPPPLAASAGTVEYVIVEARAVEPRPLRAPGPRRRARRSPR